MKRPADVEFHEDIRLLIYRPHGVLNEQSVEKIVGIIRELESKLQEPFNRFFDTCRHDEVELNYQYVIQISLYRVLSYGDRPPVKPAILATDSTIIHYCQLHAIITEDSRSMFEYSNNEKTPRSGSPCQSSGWLRNSPTAKRETET